MRNKMDNGVLSESAAWEMVRTALKNSLWDSAVEFNKLPPIIRKAIGSSYTLKEWAIAESQEVETVISSNFQRSYRAEVEKQRKMDRLSEKEKSALGIVESEAPMALISEAIVKPMDSDDSSLSTNEIDKQISNIYKMAAEMREEKESQSVINKRPLEMGKASLIDEEKRRTAFEMLSQIQEQEEKYNVSKEKLA